MCSIVGVLEHVTDDLKARRDPSASCHHANLLHGQCARWVLLGLALELQHARGRVLNVTLGSNHINAVANLQSVKVLGELAALGKLGRQGVVDLDDEVEIAEVIVTGDGSVGANN